MPAQDLFQLSRDPDFRTEWIERQLALPLPDREHVTLGRPAPDVSFAGWTFPGNVSFVGGQFPHDANFSRCTFHGSADFSRCQFSEEASFEGAIIHGEASFVAARFAQSACFDRAKAHKSLSLSGASVDGILTLIETEVAGRLVLDGANAGYRSDLTALTVGDGVTFNAGGDIPTLLLDRSKLGGEVIFPRSILHDASFMDAEFAENVVFRAIAGDANFQRAVFCKSAGFKGAINGVANFSAAHFRGVATFIGPVGALSFRSTRFDGSVMIRGQVNGSLDFTDALCAHYLGLSSHVLGPCNLGHATFSHSVNFSKAEFDSGITLRLALFRSRARFVGTKFHGGLDLQEVHFAQAPDFHNSEWASPPLFSVGIKFQACFPDITSEHSEGAYVTMKRLCRSVEAHSEERQFFALEARSRAYREGPAARLLAGMYAVISDFGQSIVRPLFLLVAIAIGGAAGIYLPIFRDATACQGGGQVAAGLLYSVRQSVPILYPFMSSLEKTIECHFPPHFGGPPSLLVAVGACHAILAATLLFLAGLAIRNRFRLQ